MGRYKEGRAPSGNPTNGERDVWFDAGEVKFGHYVSASDTWVVDNSLDYRGFRISNIIEEDTKAHYHGKADPVTERLVVKELPMKTGMTKGTYTGGKMPLLNVDAKIKDASTGAITSITSTHEVVIDIPFAQVLALDPDFNLSTGQLAFWNETTSAWESAASAGVTVTKTSDSFKLTQSSWPTDDRVIACW